MGREKEEVEGERNLGAGEPRTARDPEGVWEVGGGTTVLTSNLYLFLRLDLGQCWGF